jgi:diacylglycerol kinase (ATP)
MATNKHQLSTRKQLRQTSANQACTQDPAHSCQQHGSFAVGRMVHVVRLPLRMRVALLANPWSGRGAGPARARAIAAALEPHGWDTRLHISESRLDTVNWGRELSGNVDRVVVIGGDGTLNAAVEGMLEAANSGAAIPPVLQVGLGTANLLTHELGLPRRDRQLAELVEAGTFRPFDCGSLQLDTALGAAPSPRPCLLVWDFGLGGAVMKAMDEVRTGPIRKSNYAGLLLGVMRNYQPAPQHVVVDGEDLGEFEYGIVTGIRTYASSAIKFPQPQYDDGLWEVYLFPKVNRRMLLGLAGRALLRRIEKTPGLVHRQGRSILVSGAEPAPVQIDGDYFGHTPVEFTLSGRTIPILCPPRR